MTDVPASRVIVDEEGERVEIVPYFPSHLDRVVRMYGDYPTEHRSHGLPPVLEDELEAWIASLAKEGRSFVALLAGNVVGHAAYAPVTAVTPDFVVFVDPEYQDRGIGTALVYHVVRNIAAAGFQGAVSYVDRDNDSAVHVYEKIGFEDVEHDSLVVKMRLDLSESAPNGDGNLDELYDV